MLAAYASSTDAQNPLEGLVVGEVPEPAVGAGQVRVSVRAASLNMHDLWSLRGVGVTHEHLPLVLGMDAAGVLDDGTEVLVYPVITSPQWRGDETMDPRRGLVTEAGHQGTFAQQVVVPERNVLPKPAGLSWSEAASLGTSWLTAYRMLFTRSGLRAGQTMLVQGASGGVATALIALGRQAGLRVWATARTEEKRHLATEVGAHQAFEPGSRLPEKVDGVFDSVGRATWDHSLKSLRPGGVVVTCGATSGEPEGTQLTRIFFQQMRVIGSTMGTRDELTDLLRLCETTGLRPTIGQELPLERAHEAFQAMLDGDTAGKIVLTV